MTTQTPVKTSKRATAKQIALLVRLGVAESDAAAMPMTTASETIDKLIQAERDALKDAIAQINVDLRDYAGTYTTLHRASGTTELSGPCPNPKCGGTDRFHVTADWFFCRQCHAKRGDALEFVQWLDGVDLKTAVAKLTNTPLPAPATKRAPKRKAAQDEKSDWNQQKADRCAAESMKRLFDDADAGAEAGRRYLLNRGLEPHTWQAFKLGYMSDAPLPGTWDDEKKERTHPCQPAIVIPWFRGNRIVAIRYRFLEEHTYTNVDGDEKTQKSGAQFQSDFRSMFGGQALDTGITELSTLVLCEGELNAASIWQVSIGAHLDVFSMGSESASISPAMVEHAQRYATVITWLDDEKYVKRAMEALPGAVGVKSPGGRDANDLLRDGQLGAFLAAVRFQAAKTRHEQERLYYDLLDAAALPGSVDAGTLERIQVIGKALGKVQA